MSEIRFAKSGSRTSSTRQVTSGHVAALLVDGHDPAEIRGRGELSRANARPMPEAAPVTATTGWPRAFRGRHQVLTLH